ncbi:MAG: glycosyltransferase family 2 protein [Lentisphaerae bacterium]|nr:glycosyltransferase family 2 protein [Lentisphaerota bacterium]
MDPGKLSVVIPVYNEAPTIEQIARAVSAVNLNLAKELVLVDDGSTDGTREVLRRLQADHPEWKIIFHDVNQGKGAALRAGFQAATGDIVLIQDADLEYDPNDYPALLAPILAGKADVVYGSRFLGGGPHRVVFFWHSVGNKLLTLLSNMMTDLNLTDVEVGYKVFRSEILRGLTLCERRFGFEIEITAKVARRRCRIYEVPIAYYGRDYSEGKKITWKDGFRALWCIFKYHFA